MEIRRLKQHLKDTVAVNLIGSCLDFLVLTWTTPKFGRDQSRTELVEKVESRQMGTARDLDQLGEYVSNLSLGKGSKESKIEEGMHRRVVGTETVVVVAVVDSNFDADAGVNEADYGRWDTDVVGVAAIGSAGKSKKMC